MQHSELTAGFMLLFKPPFTDNNQNTLSGAITEILKVMHPVCYTCIKGLRQTVYDNKCDVMEYRLYVMTTHVCCYDNHASGMRIKTNTIQ